MPGGVSTSLVLGSRVGEKSICGELLFARDPLSEGGEVLPPPPSSLCTLLADGEVYFCNELVLTLPLPLPLPSLSLRVCFISSAVVSRSTGEGKEKRERV